MKYKIGDRVKVIEEEKRDDLIGKVGTIIDYDNWYYYEVEFDEYIYGHTLDGKGKKEHCWFFDKDQLELAEEKREKKQEPTDLNKVLQKLSDKISELADSSEEFLELLKDITNKN